MLRLISYPNYEYDLLPEGVHLATVDQLKVTFAYNLVRRRLFSGFAQASIDLKKAGCQTVWLDGSFVTSKDLPGDFDAIWCPKGVVERLLPRVIADLSGGTKPQKDVYGGELYPNVQEARSGMPFVEFFQSVRSSDLRKGIVEVDLGNATFEELEEACR